MKLYFLTTNENKREEAKAFFEQPDVKAHNIEFCVIGYDVQEILDPDLKLVVGKKALEAYRHLNRPCLVEKSGLYLKDLPGTPRTAWENNLECCWRSNV